MNLWHIVRRYIWIAPLALGFVFVGAGIYLWTEAQSAKDEVLHALANENIITAEDASIPGVLVDDVEKARSEMDWIEAFYLELTEGKRYAELDRDDPNREIVFELVQLRTSINVAVVEIRVADLAIALSIVIVTVGGVFILFVAPAVYYSAEVADHYDELKKKDHSQRQGPTRVGTHEGAPAGAATT